MAHPDICIVGAGVIGLSLALELHHRGARVTVLERDTALSHASTAAAGMLALDDPENPAQLHPLSALSIALYPAFLTRIESLAGTTVPFQTSRTFQSHPSYSDNFDPTLLPQLTPGKQRFTLLKEHSLDPRQLADALLAAVRNTSIQLREHTSFRSASLQGSALRIDLSSDNTLDTSQLVDARGAWSGTPVTPRKGQMFMVALSPSLPLHDVVRTPDIYIVPRTVGTRAGHTIIGATIEEAGFDTITNAIDLARLRALAAEVLPPLADESLFPMTSQWAGLRPATPDELPLLGALPGSSNHFLAAGHYRNGILLAPATAHLMAQLLSGEKPSLDLLPFAPSRFPHPAESPTRADIRPAPRDNTFSPAL
jgi:glycine oxidase